ncbi:ComEC/Rec2 family competence protein [Aminomonas paucivorans]|uniref:ComEC/Rec2 family competence protein n=1 Tax=Aminomonas paucivorans TaxID=81412 RepID=UPI00332A968F
MCNFYEIDFLPVRTNKSGDAIAIRYSIGHETLIHVVDGGFLETGEILREHIQKYYMPFDQIDHVVVTHSDSDHTNGLRNILESFKIGKLWMLRPWEYADKLLNAFYRFKYVENLKDRLKQAYPSVAALEDIANQRKIPIYAPLQGARIGAFTVMAPTLDRYLNLIKTSEKTPDTNQNLTFQEMAKSAYETLQEFVLSPWGEEIFPSRNTSDENEMSVIQYAELCSKKILLTGDAGRNGLQEAANYALSSGLKLPGIDIFQVPHHGSRRNVSSEVLDNWLGKKLKYRPENEVVCAIISSAEEDKDHPRKSVIRALIHRGASVFSTEGKPLCCRANTPTRYGWESPEAIDYPNEQEID